MFGQPIDEITFEDVVSFCAQQTREHERLEYKQEFSSKDSGKQIAKEAAAFANTQGGMIVFGVEEEKNRKPRANPTGLPLGNDPDRKVLSACAHNVFPPITPEVSSYLKNTKDRTRGFLVVRVAPSVDIHTVEGGKGIYIRTGDQSEPVRADLEMIEYLLARRKSATDLQDQRRAGGRLHLEPLVQSMAAKPCLWVTIGPQITVAPLLELRELRDNAADFSVTSTQLGMSSPIDPRTRVRAALDSVYSVDLDKRYAGLVDVFGNITLYSQLSRRISEQIFHYTVDTDALAKAPKSDGEFVGVDATQIAAWLLAMYQSAKRLYGGVGFVGLLKARLVAAGVQDVPLFAHLLGRGAGLLGTCPTSENLDLEWSLASTDLGEDAIAGEPLIPIVARLLWAWGCTRDEAAPHVVDIAERAHFGSEPCPKRHNEFKPCNRALCFACRSKATEQT